MNIREKLKRDTRYYRSERKNSWRLMLAMMIISQVIAYAVTFMLLRS